MSASSRRHRIARRLLLLLVTLTVSVSLAAPPASASVPPPSGGAPCKYTCVANRIEFVSWKGNFAYYYKYYYGRPYWKSGFNYTTDGCSIPSNVPYRDTYSKFFATSCRVHDFGYRNFGPDNRHPHYTVWHYKPYAEAGTDDRLAIDDRLHANMDHQCGLNPPSVRGVPDSKTCFAASDIIYEFVRGVGYKYW